MVCCCCFLLFADLVSSIVWVFPNDTKYNINQNQAYQSEIGKSYVRFPPRAKGKVQDVVYSLSRHAAGVSIFFECNSDALYIEYVPEYPYYFDSSPRYSTSGVDLYAYDSSGVGHACVGEASFGQKVTYTFEGLNRQTYEYRLILPTCDVAKQLRIGYSEGSYIRFFPTQIERPIAIYGTSITQGQGSNRPGTTWANWLGREMELPVYNFGFLGSAFYEESVINFIIENDALVYIFDCIANLIGVPAGRITDLAYAAYHQVRAKWPDTPIVMIDHAGLASTTFHLNDDANIKNANAEQKAAFDKLISEGATNLYHISKEDLGYVSDDFADIVHPTDSATHKHMMVVSGLLRKILHMEKSTLSTQRPVISLRNTDFRFRSNAIIETIRNEKSTIRKVILGDSITNFWGGRPDYPTKTGRESWDKYLEPEGFINQGISADRIENCLWRVYHDCFYNISFEKIVLFIGTNNLIYPGIKNTDISEGIRFLCQNIQVRQPKAQIIVMGILPRRNFEEQIVAVNELIEKVCQDGGWKYINPGLELALPSGKVDESCFGDGLHPNAKGYNIIAPLVAAA